ncbi:hypothetical protein MKW92_002322 [Papaver armeniacum]|nr:hypothetical protein MKW92_002322 [Papaver armeniacum]
MSKTQGNFKLHIMEGEFTDSQIVVMLGEYGTGKTTFIRMLKYLNLMCLTNPRRSVLSLYLLLETFCTKESMMVKNLSGGERERAALCFFLGKRADIYLIDEPCAYLDSEQRIVAPKVIKRFILHPKKTAFVVEHDFLVATYHADRVIVFEGRPSIDSTANAPQSLLTGVNLFLSQLDIAFRRDPTNFRPGINKLESTKDKEQKAAETFYYLN